MVENFLAGLKGARGPFFVGSDVALRLGYTDPQKAINMHIDDEDKLTRQIVVSGLYLLRLKPQAQAERH